MIRVIHAATFCLMFVMVSELTCLAQQQRPVRAVATPREVKVPRVERRPADTKDIPSQMAAVDLKLARVLDGKGDNEKRDYAVDLSGPADQVMQTLNKLEESGQIIVADRIHLTCVDGYACFVQSGERTPVVTGSQVTRGGVANSYRLESTGMLMGVTPHIGDGRVVLELDFEKSRIEPMVPVNDQDQKDSGARPPKILTLTCQTTLSITADNSLAVSSIESGSGESWVLVVTARTIIPSK